MMDCGTNQRLHPLVKAFAHMLIGSHTPLTVPLLGVVITRVAVMLLHMLEQF